MNSRIKTEYKSKKDINWLMQTIFRCTVFSLIFCISSLYAGGLSNPGFENGNADGWTIDAGKGGKLEVIPSMPHLKNYKKNNKGWKKVPYKYNFFGPKNKYFLNVKASRASTLATESNDKIVTGKKYTISISGISQSKGKTFALKVFYAGSDGTKHLIGVDSASEESYALFMRSVTFTTKKGMSCIGKRLILILTCDRKGFYVDNADIKVENPPKLTGLEKAVNSLPLVNVLDKKEALNFTVNTYKDFRYTQPIEQKGTLENTGSSFPELVRLSSTGNPDYVFYNLKSGLTLLDGESASLLVSLHNRGTYAGLAVDKNIFVLGLNKFNVNPFVSPDYLAYIARVSPEIIRNETIVISRTGNRIDWFTCGRKGSYEIKGLAKSAELTLFTRGDSSVQQLRKGKLSKTSKTLLASFIDAPHSPFGRPNLSFPDYQGPKFDTVLATIQSDMNKPVSKEEITALIELSKSYPAYGIGVAGNSLSDIPPMYILAKAFLVTRSKTVLDEMIRVADRAIISRNGYEVNGVQYGVIDERDETGKIRTQTVSKGIKASVPIDGAKDRYINTFDGIKHPLYSEEGDGWFYFNEKHQYVRKYIITSSSNCNTYTIVPALTAYCISLHPEIWDKKVPSDSMNLGATYGERARHYIKELALIYADYRDYNTHWFRTTPFYKNFTESTAKRNEDQDTFISTPAVNRFISGASCTGFAGNAAETFGDKESMKKIDSLGEKMLESWFVCFNYYAPGHNLKYLNEPEKWYRTAAYTQHHTTYTSRDYKTDTEPGQGHPRSEDRGHVNFTFNGLQLLYDSHRYEHIMTKKRMTEFARTINETVLPKYNLWNVLPRARHAKHYNPQKGFNYQYSAMLMFGDFNAELKVKLLKCLIEYDNKRKWTYRTANKLNLALMRAKKFNQIPKKIVE